LGEQSDEFKCWLDQQCEELKHGYCEEVLAALNQLQPTDETAKATATLASQLQYLDKRLEIGYKKFQSLGYPMFPR